jgi:hypothetical protein
MAKTDPYGEINNFSGMGRPHLDVRYSTCEPKSKLNHGSTMAHLWLMHGSFMAHSWLIHGSIMAQFMAHLWNNHGSFMAHSWLMQNRVTSRKKSWLNHGSFMAHLWLMQNRVTYRKKSWLNHGSGNFRFIYFPAGNHHGSFAKKIKNPVEP